MRNDRQPPFRIDEENSVMHRRASLICRWVFASSAAVLMSAVSLFAADKLPKDGAWARYYVYSKMPDGNEYASHRTIRFVGTVVENGKTHRWIEWSLADAPADGGKKKPITFVRKFLLTEKSLRESSHPLREFVRGWEGFEGKTPRRIATKGDDRELAIVSAGGSQLLFLPGVLKTTKPSRSSRTIDYQHGQLRVKSGCVGTYEDVYRPMTAPLASTWKTDYELWLHRDVPLGMASVKKKMVLIRKDAKGKKTVRDLGTSEWWVEAWGTDAKSAFPDAK
jgi:hypothetical protein